MVIPEILKQKNGPHTEDIKFSLTTLTVTSNNQVKKVTFTEWSLLKKLVENQNRVTTIRSLEQNIYGDRCDKINSNVLAVHIHNLRRKFPEFRIKAIRGIGYVLEYSK
jgi:DNA-binding response OmpR family regulator